MALGVISIDTLGEGDGWYFEKAMKEILVLTQICLVANTVVHCYCMHIIQPNNNT